MTGDANETTTAPSADLRRAWHSRLAQARANQMSDILIVQCSLHWLRPPWLTFRNELDEALLHLSLRQPDPPRITRLVLLNLPVIDEAGRSTEALRPCFEEWRSRMAAGFHLLHRPSGQAPVVQRLIVPTRRFNTPVPDLVAIRRHGQWTDPGQVGEILGLLATPGATSPLAGYHMTWDRATSDADPSVHL